MKTRSHLHDALCHKQEGHYIAEKWCPLQLEHQGLTGLNSTLMHSSASSLDTSPSSTCQKAGKYQMHISQGAGDGFPVFDVQKIMRQSMDILFLHFIRQ